MHILSPNYSRFNRQLNLDELKNNFNIISENLNTTSQIFERIIEENQNAVPFIEDILESFKDYLRVFKRLVN